MCKHLLHCRRLLFDARCFHPWAQPKVAMLLQVALIKAQIGALATCLMSLTHAGMAVDASVYGRCVL